MKFYHDPREEGPEDFRFQNRTRRIPHPRCALDRQDGRSSQQGQQKEEVHRHGPLIGHEFSIKD